MTNEERKDLVFEKYLDANGLMSGDGSVTGNGLRYTSEYLLGLERNRIYDLNDAYQFFPVIDSCMVKTGLFRRSPQVGGDQQGPDDYIALISMSVAMKQKYHIFIYEFAQKNNWIFLNATANVSTLKSAFLGRFPQFIAHVLFANKKKPSLWQRIIWAYNVALGPRVGDQDSWILAWHLKEVYKLSGFSDKIENLAIKFFEYLEFNLPEQKEEYQVCIEGGACHSAIWDMLNHLRSKLKYEELDERDRIIYEQIQSKFFDCLKDNNLDF